MISLRVFLLVLVIDPLHLLFLLSDISRGGNLSQDRSCTTKWDKRQKCDPETVSRCLFQIFLKKGLWHIVKRMLRTSFSFHVNPPSNFAYNLLLFIPCFGMMIPGKEEKARSNGIKSCEGGRRWPLTIASEGSSRFWR